MVQVWSVGGCGVAWLHAWPDLYYSQVGKDCFDGSTVAHEVSRAGGGGGCVNTLAVTKCNSDCAVLCGCTVESA
jgi:hypothetical protein